MKHLKSHQNKRKSHVNPASFLKSAGGRFFSVVFIKRSTGEVRKMRCRFGVHSYLKGGQPAYDFEAHHLLCVFDVEKLEYRTINLDGLISAKVNGKHITF